ncbi:MAG: Smr/MutS family protein [Muribaculaceae bacterium]|nr:Smr/MutS family protein [Muribaculaceae bacterium]
MIYPDNFEQKIGFDTIRQLVLAECNSFYGKKAAEEMHFSNDFDVVTRWLSQTNEMLSIITGTADYPAFSPVDVASWLGQLKSEGGYVPAVRYLDLLKMIRQAEDVRKFFHNPADGDRSAYPALSEIAGRIFSLHEIITVIERAINNFGEIKDNASERLFEIRSQLRSANGSMQRAMRRVLDRAIEMNIIDRDVTPAVRDGRMVIPVEASRKRALQGIVHDSSATGKTVYIEPLEVVEASNHIRELRMMEQHEEIEILKAIALNIRPHLDDIFATAKVMGQFEFIAAKAKFARSVDGRLPVMERDRVIEWYHAVHPVLFLSLRSQDREVVPLNLTLDDRQRILIISGPNAGGKSVALKTTGVIQYMTQCGLLPTLYENSHVGIFDNLYVDLGDEQSMESDLSTYSSHLKNMKYILQHSSRRTLILIDEMGSGTEPQIGGALAQAILAVLADTGCMGIVTTHYHNLKVFAAEQDGLVNGAMLYDRQHLQPTFRLSVGDPGSSFALEIARKIGLDNRILENARQIVGSEYVNMDKYLLDIARDRRYWDNKRRNIKEKEAKLDRLLSMYEDKSDDLKSQRNAILHEAKAEAREILAAANARIEKAIREIRNANAEREQTKQIRRELEAYKMAVTNDEEQTDALPEPLKDLKHKSRERAVKRQQSHSVQSKKPGEYVVGDYVTIKDSGVVGRILRIEGKKAEVAFGSLRTMADINKLVPAAKPKNDSLSAAQYTISRHTSDESRARQLNFKQDIDVRGMRGDEAVQAVIYFLDDAVQFGASRLRILHGTGHGILKTLIRQQLDAYPAVKSYRDEDVRFGGAGITIVEL